MAIWDDVIPAEEQAAYEKGGWGGRVGFGERPAVIVVDMNNAFVDPRYPYSSPPAQAAVPHIRRLLEVARSRSAPVLFTTGARPRTPAERGRWKSAGISSPLMESPQALEIYSELAPQPGEIVISKNRPSAFFGTDLASLLIYSSVDTLIVAGTVTSGCVRATCLDAFNYNFRVIVPQECVCDRGQVSHKVALFEIHTKYGDVIPVEEVLSYLEALPPSERD
jgi:nicotinamidase-related amidase